MKKPIIVSAAILLSLFVGWGLSKEYLLEVTPTPPHALNFESGIFTTPSTAKRIPNSKVESSIELEETNTKIGHEDLNDTAAEVAPSLQTEIKENPDIVYRKFIKNAELGNSSAQFVVSQSLRSCQYAKPTDEQLEAISYDHNIDQSIKTAVFNYLDKCRPLYDLLPGTDTKEAYLSWLETAAMNGSNIAKLQMDLSYYVGTYENKHFVQLFPRVFEEAGNDPYLQNQVYHSIGQYLSQYADWKDTERRGWELVLCRSEPSCNELDTLQVWSEGEYHEYEIETIIKKSEVYEDAMERKDWSYLDLDIPSN